MCRKILIPLDSSKEAEGVFPLMREELEPDGEVILLQVIPPAKTRVIGGHTILATQQEEAERSKAESYCTLAFREYVGDIQRWRCETVVADSVSRGIVEFAKSEGVDLIAMYTHDRKGIAAMIKRSIAKDVQRSAPIDVKVFKPQELMAVI